MNGPIKICGRKFTPQLAKSGFSPHGGFPGEDIPLHKAGGTSPAKEESKALLNRMTMLEVKTVLTAIDFPGGIIPRMMADPAVNKMAVLPRPKFLQRFQAEANTVAA